MSCSCGPCPHCMMKAVQEIRDEKKNKEEYE